MKMKNEFKTKAGRQGSRAWEGKEIFQSDSYRGGLGTSATAHHMSRGNKQQVTTSSNCQISLNLGLLSIWAVKD